MTDPKRVLFFAENALSAIQGGGIVAYAVLRGLPGERLLGFYDYRNITPVPEYADRFEFLGPRRLPLLASVVDCTTGGWIRATLRFLCAGWVARRDFRFVRERVDRDGFQPDVVYFSGLSYRYIRLAVMAAEHYGLPMVILHMDDWMEVERREAGVWGWAWHRRIVKQMTRAAARSLASTTNSPRLARKVTALTGYRHVAANNCCSDLHPAPRPDGPRAANAVPVITYAGAMNQHLQGEGLKILAGAVTELNAEGTPVQLHIYTPWEFAPTANAISVPGAVFYKGQVGREQLAEVYGRSDFLVTTVTHRDRHIGLFRHSLSTKLSEYLCVGKPVISMGHRDWHLHEYVQDHACGFSIPMDEDYSRAKIKTQLREILATQPDRLAEIGRRNRALWERAHDVARMAQPTRRAVGLEPPGVSTLNPSARRGVVWVGKGDRHGGWMPLSKLKMICLRLQTEFEHGTVDFIGDDVRDYPDLERLRAYCHQIGLRVEVVGVRDLRGRNWEPAGTRWSLAPAQRSARHPLDPTEDVFTQVASLRHGSPPRRPSAVQRAINQLSVVVDEQAVSRPRVWFYGSPIVALRVIAEIERHRWLRAAVEIAGFLSSPGLCDGDTLHGRPWRSVDDVDPEEIDFVVTTSETSRLAIQEQLARYDLLGRAIPLYGMVAESARYERVPDNPGQEYVAGATAHDYASRELVEWIRRESRSSLNLEADTLSIWTPSRTEEPEEIDSLPRAA